MIQEKLNTCKIQDKLPDSIYQPIFIMINLHVICDCKIPVYARTCKLHVNGIYKKTIKIILLYVYLYMHNQTGKADNIFITFYSHFKYLKLNNIILETFHYVMTR